MATDDLRFSRLEELLEIALDLQGSLSGRTLDDIMSRYGVSRRTATRMLGSVRRAVGEDQFESETGADGRKRWRLARPAVNGVFRLGADELAALDRAGRLAAREGDARLADEVASISRKLRALSPPDWLVHVDPDLEAMVEAEGFAFRAGPRPRVDDALLESLRQAILTQRRVRLRHRKVAEGRPAWQTVGPLGFLYGSRHYLVAWSEQRRKVVLFRLSRIDRVEALASGFEGPEDFDLDAFARRSFGVFQEEAFDVAWRFLPRAAAEAREYLFHPDQTVEERPDGSLVVRFRAGGLYEMAWHLFSWGRDVEILEPQALRREMQRWLALALRQHGTDGLAASRSGESRTRRLASGD
jgi:predicted DNA-binding transcriptional regulator YafY